MEPIFLYITKKYPKISKTVLILVAFLLSLSLLKNFRKTLDVQDQIERERRKVEDLKQENELLRKEVEKVTSDTHIEKQLRDKLGLAKEGEYVVVLPDDEIVKKLAPRLVFEEDTKPLENWRKWLLLFQ